MAIDLRSVKRAFLYTAIACVAGAALLAIFAVANRHLSHDNAIVLGSALLLGLSSSLSLACSAGWAKAPLVAGLGIGLAIAAAATAYIPIWGGDHRDFLWKLPVILYVIAMAIAYALLLASKQSADASDRVKAAFAIALLSILLLCAIIVGLVAGEDRSDPTALGVTAVLTVSMTLITLLLRRLDTVTASTARAPGALVGRRIAIVEDGDLGTILVLDDGRRLLLDPGARLD